jgi:hypothetical protein
MDIVRTLLIYNSNLSHHRTQCELAHFIFHETSSLFLFFSFVILIHKRKKYSIEHCNLSIISETTSSDVSGKEWVTKSFTCFKALIGIISKKPLNKINKIPSRMINMLHHKILHELHY